VLSKSNINILKASKIDILSDVYKLVNIDVSIDGEHNMPKYQDIWTNLYDDGGFDYSLYKDDISKEFENSKYKDANECGIERINELEMKEISFLELLKSKIR
jgi:hypothetical protein